MFGKAKRTVPFPARDARFELITCVVQRGKGDDIAKAAMAAGAGGATVFYARGMGVRDRMGLLGLAIVPEKEVVQVVTPQSDTKAVFEAVATAAGLDTPGLGIAWVTKVEAVAGIFAPAAEAESEPKNDERQSGE